MTKRRSTRGGFTLVELLVVIGIIALLIAILLPTLVRARQQAMRTICLTHLREWGMGFSLYAQENHGFYAFEMLRDLTGPNTGDWMMWFGHRPGSNITTGGGPLKTDDSLLNRYLPAKEGLYNDPALGDIAEDVQVSAATPTLAPQRSPCYGTGWDLIQEEFLLPIYGYTVAVNTSTVKDPTETMLLADCATYSTISGGGTILERFRAISYPSTMATIFPTFHGRHPGGGNVLWFDGHVSTVPVTPIPAAQLVSNVLGSYYNSKLQLGHLMPPGATYTSLNANFYFWLDKRKKNILPFPVSGISP